MRNRRYGPKWIQTRRPSLGQSRSSEPVSRFHRTWALTGVSLGRFRCETASWSSTHSNACHDRGTIVYSDVQLCETGVQLWRATRLRGPYGQEAPFDG